MIKRILFTIALISGLSATTSGYAAGNADHEVIPLYSGVAPGSEGWKQKEGSLDVEDTRFKPANPDTIVWNVTRPTLTVFRPAPGKSNGTAVVVAPGGGFRVLSYKNEGLRVAQYLADRGYTAFVLKYRLHEMPDDPAVMRQALDQMLAGATPPAGAAPPAGPPRITLGPVEKAGISDGVRAVELVRSRAKEFGVSPDRVGIIGFSAGGAVSGNSAAAQAGQGVVLGAGTAAQRGFLVYQRSMEATADESAIRYLEATHQSAKGMLDLFHVLANESIATTHGADPYAYSHPMPFDRIRAMEATAQASAYYNAVDPPALVLRHQLAKAKLIGFLEPQLAFQKYPSSDTSLPARYARAIAYFRRGDMTNALPLIDSLTASMPQDPYFWELKAQAYLENGRADQGLPAIKKARAILPNNGLLQILHAQVLLGSENPAHADEAIALLKLAQRTEGDEASIYRFLAQAYGLKNQIAEANLATAEYAYATGDKSLAVEKATLAQKYLKKGSPEWLRAGDIVAFAAKK